MIDKNGGLVPIADRLRAEIVDRLYDVALDPIRLEDLLDVWEGYVGPLRQLPAERGLPIDDPEIEAHIGRASVFLDRYEAARRPEQQSSVLEQIPRSAAFLSEGGAQITAFNRPAAQVFRLREGALLTDLPFDPEDVATLASAIRRVVAGRSTQVITLRLRSTLSNGPVIVRVGPIGGPDGRSMALVLSTEFVWPDGFSGIVQEAFGMTLAEVEVLRGLMLGQPVREIAEARGRSLETVRTQIRSILAKSETRGQSELIRVIHGLMDVVQPQAGRPAEKAPGSAAAGRSGAGILAPTQYRSLEVTDPLTGKIRRLDWTEFGAELGTVVLYTHLAYGLLRWPAPAERAAHLRGLRVIAPVRAGYGATSPLAPGQSHLDGVTEDYLAVLDHLGVGRCVIVAQGADLRFAMNVARRRPGLVTGIIGCSAQLPLRNAEQYARMDKWQRFILANARYAPKVVPFLVKAAFGYARRMGKERFLAQVNGRSPGDLATLARPDVREAMLIGTEITLGDRSSAHEAFAAECIGSEQDWSQVVRDCPAPVVMLVADQDPLTPLATIRELAVDYPRLDLRLMPGTGQFLFFARWAEVLDLIDEIQRDPAMRPQHNSCLSPEWGMR